jgi:hypothetical protein
MDFSKLSSNDKLAAIGAVLAIVGAFLSFGGGGSFGVLTGIAMLVIIFLPQFSPATKLPGSKGSLMMIVGGVSALGAILGLLAILTVFGAFAFYGGSYFIGALIGTGGQALMAWASWQTFQAEGGKFNMSMPSAPSAPPAPPASTYTPPPPVAPPAQEPMSDQGSEDHPQA